MANATAKQPQTYETMSRWSRADLKRLFPDTGCDVSTRCLECPLPQCRYDDPFWYQLRRRQQRDQDLIELWDAADALPGPERLALVAALTGVTERTVHRVRRRARLEGLVT